MSMTDDIDAATALTVGHVAELVGVSVRTLHHWDEIGLVSPARTRADYRLYSGEDVARIHRVLLYREVGVTLDDVARILDDPTVSARDHLARQRHLLLERIDSLAAKVTAVDRMMEEEQMNKKLTPQEQAEIFGTDWNPEYAEEAEQRWGGTEQWAQSRERVGGMSKEDMTRWAAEGEALNRDLATAMAAGVEAGSDAANALAERHRAMISASYDCTHSMQVLLGRMYVADARFAEYYEKYAAGLAAWLSQVIDANARVHGVDPETATWE